MNPLDEIAARADAATEGPWWLHGDGESICYQFHNGDTRDYDRLAVATYPATADAEFIAHAREDVPALVAALKAVEAAHVRWDSEEFYNDIDGGSRSNIKWYCGTCVDSDERPRSWPCPTITAICEALGS